MKYFDKKIKNVVIVGLGYVGLPTLVAIEKTGYYDVSGFDIDKSKIEKIRNNKSVIEDLEVEFFIKNNKLKVFSSKEKIKNNDVFIICVPTPIDGNYQPDYSILENAVSLVSNYAKKGNHIIIESTINPGTCEERLAPIIEKISNLKVGKEINLTHCPERINPGDPKWSIYNINRNIGSINKKLNKIVADFYRSFLPEATINTVSSLKVAESTKIIENTFRDINIAYVNELAMSFDVMGIDLKETIEAASNKPFGFMAHWPGRGVGGHCIAVDPYYLIKRAGLSGFDHRFLKMAREINNGMPRYTVNRLQDALNEFSKPIKNSKIALLGLSYKSNIADLRESPCLKILEILKEMGAKIFVFDPLIPNVSNVKKMDDALDSCEAVILGTYHDIFGNLEKEFVKRKNIKIIIDGVNKLDKNFLIKNNILYKGIGR